jgi:hypothetical protein
MTRRDRRSKEMLAPYERGVYVLRRWYTGAMRHRIRLAAIPPAERDLREEGELKYYTDELAGIRAILDALGESYNG